MRNNSVQLIGWVADSPRIIKYKNGGKLAIIRVATHHLIKSGTDKPINCTTWHDVFVWDDRATWAERSFVKGSKIQVWGAIEYKKYVDKSGTLHNTAEVRAFDIDNLDR